MEMTHPITDITIIGGGPTGLFASFYTGMRGATAQIVDALPQLGGQVTALYPEKFIFDVGGFAKVLAKDLVKELVEQAAQFKLQAHLNQNVTALEQEEDHLVLVTETDRFPTRAIVIAAGIGAFSPRRLPQACAEPWYGRGIYDRVSNPEDFRGQRIVIIGGGDSAFDWVVNLLDTASEITLVHRRDGFRAHEATVSEVMGHVAAGRVDLKVPYVIKGVEGNGEVEAVDLHHADGESVERVGCDAVLLQLGFSTKLGPLKEWGFEIQKGALVVDGLMKTNLDRVWACGDITTFDGKLKLIATGFAESAIAVSQAVHTIRPDMKIQPAYSTNTGVPGQTPGDVAPSDVEPVGAPGTAEGQV